MNARRLRSTICGVNDILSTKKQKSRTSAQKGTSLRTSADRSEFTRTFLKQRYLHLMILLPFLIILVFNYFPMYGLVVAFQNYKYGRIWGSTWVGFRWFEQFLGSPYFLRTAKNTLVLGALSIIFGFPAPIILALLLNEIRNSAFKRITQSISYLPHFVSTVIIVGLLKEMASLTGLFNKIVMLFGGDGIIFFLRPEWFRPMYIGSDIWRSVGWGSVIFLAAISGVDPELYEAATIDGANRWHQMRHVTIASIMPTIIILFILRIGGILGNDFEKILLMYNPNIYETADVISTYVYREGLENTRYSYGAAVGFFLNVVSFLFIFTANFISRRVSETSLW